MFTSETENTRIFTICDSATISYTIQRLHEVNLYLSQCIEKVKVFKQKYIRKNKNDLTLLQTNHIIQFSCRLTGLIYLRKAERDQPRRSKIGLYPN